DAQALRLMQGVPARMPDRCRYGAHEDRGAGGAGCARSPVWARPFRRLSTALCPVRFAPAMVAQSARPDSGAGVAVGTRRGLQRSTQPAALAPAIPRA